MPSGSLNLEFFTKMVNTEQQRTPHEKFWVHPTGRCIFTNHPQEQSFQFLQNFAGYLKVTKILILAYHNLE